MQRQQYYAHMQRLTHLFASARASVSCLAVRSQLEASEQTPSTLWASSKITMALSHRTWVQRHKEKKQQQ